jgi:hypothetical protein
MRKSKSGYIRLLGARFWLLIPIYIICLWCLLFAMGVSEFSIKEYIAMLFDSLTSDIFSAILGILLFFPFVFFPILSIILYIKRPKVPSWDKSRYEEELLCRKSNLYAEIIFYLFLLITTNLCIKFSHTTLTLDNIFYVSLKYTFIYFLTIKILFKVINLIMLLKIFIKMKNNPSENEKGTVLTFFIWDTLILKYDSTTKGCFVISSVLEPATDYIFLVFKIKKYPHETKFIGKELMKVNNKPCIRNTASSMKNEKFYIPPN